jgi:cell division protein FtsB
MNNRRRCGATSRSDKEVQTLALGYKARHVLRRMRDHYEAMLSMACQTSPSEEATIARLTQANAELAAEVARLKAELAEAESQNWAKRMTAIVDEINADVRNLRADK